MLVSQISLDSHTFALISVMKGCLYVAITSLLLYWLVSRFAARRKSAADDLKESEERFRTIFDSVNDAIFIHDPATGVILDVNRRMCELYGYNHEEALRIDVGAISSGGPEYNQEEALRRIRKSASGGPQLFEWQCRKRNGELFWTEVNMKQAVIRKQKCILVTVRDISERKKAVEAEIAKEAAEAASRAKSEFLSHMSHELRTPLNSILGFSELLRDIPPSDNDTVQRYAGLIYESGNHILSLINDVLDLSKIEAGKLELKIEKFRVHELIIGSIDIFLEAASKRGIKINTNIDKAPDIMEGDKIRIKQVLFNLIGNSMKFTPDGGAIIVSAGETKPGFIKFSVTDTGIGISTEDQKKLFQPFCQLDNSDTKKFAGTGLGLSICRKIVELHGGRIWIESEVGKGSAFIFTIPAAREGD